MTENFSEITTLGDCVRINFLVSKALGYAKANLHIWLLNIAFQVKKYDTLYSKQLQSHKQYIECSKIRSENILIEQYPDYYNHFINTKNTLISDIQKNSFQIIKCKLKWLEKEFCSPFLSALLLEYDLLDEPDKLLDLIAGE